MTASAAERTGPPQPPAAAVNLAPGAANGFEPRSISGGLQLLVALYVLLTGAVPSIVQAIAFGLDGGSGNQFMLAMITQVIGDLLVIAPLLVLSGQPLGIFHPLIIAIVLWPLVRGLPTDIHDLGGWGGVLAGAAVQAPHFDGLPGRSTPAIWNAIAKHNAIEDLGLLCTYIGFALFARQPNLRRKPPVRIDPQSLRPVVLGLIGLSLIVLYIFVRSRGGINAHLTSLGQGRFKELSGDGAILVLINIGAVALYVWIAAIPSDIKSPLFLLSLLAICAVGFISNGSRGAALSAPMIVGLLWAMQRRKIPWKTALLLVPLMFLALGLLGAIRSASWSGSTAGRSFATTNWQQSFARAQQEVEERNRASADVPVVERGYDMTGGLLLGKSYAASVTSFIPRAIWKDKPRGVGSLYAQVFLGESMSGTTIPVSPTVEMYWNFGIIGVVLLSILYGAILRSVYFFYWRRYPSPFVFTFYLIFLTSFQFSSDRLTTLEQESLLIVFCYMVVRTFGRKSDLPARAPYLSVSPGPSRDLSRRVA